MPYKDKSHAIIMRKLWGQNNPKRELLKCARSRCKKSGMEFSVSPEDFEMPEYCPILGLKLKWGCGKMSDNSATLDRLNNDLGYIKGNVWVISRMANSMKTNSRYWHRAKFANWIMKSLIGNQKHISILDPRLISSVHRILKRINGVGSKKAGMSLSGVRQRAMCS